MRIFGIYGGYLNHDPGVCLVEDGKIIFSWNEERPRRLKPSDIEYQQKLLSENGTSIKSVFSDNLTPNDRDWETPGS